MAKKQFNTPELNLKAELPQVVSRDFNLFYKPEAEPEIAGLKNFTQSLDNFINGALTTGNILGETKLKEQSEAEATQFFNMEVENKKAFNSAVNKNEIPREANPYFVDKLKELELGAKAQEFKRKFKERYAKENLSENTDPNAFNFIYEQELKQFLKDNNIGLYEPVELEKNFFSKTSQFREAEENMHMNNQLSKIREQFDKNYKTGIQEFFDPDSNDFEKMGKDITDFIKSAVESGMHKSRARDLYMETLKEYVELTGDTDFANKLINELPNHIKLGTDVLGNINSLKDDFSALEDDLETRRNQEELDKIRQQELQIKKEDFVVNDLTNKYDRYTDLKKSDEFYKLNNRQKTEALKIYENRRIGFGTFDDPDAKEIVENLINNEKFDEAKEYLDNNRTLFKENPWNNLNTKVQVYIDTQDDPYIGNFHYNHAIGKVQTVIDSINDSNGFEVVVKGLYIAEFKSDIAQWLKYNPLEKYDGDESLRKKAFVKYINDSSQEYVEILTEENIDDEPRIRPKQDFSNPDINGEVNEEFDSSLLEDEDIPEPEDFKSDYLDEENRPVIFIPPDLSPVNRRKFINKYPNAITYEKFIENINKERKGNPTKENLENELVKLQTQQKTKKVRERIKEIESLLEGIK